MLSRLNRGLGLVAAVAVVIIVLLVLKRRRAARKERLAELTPFDPLRPDQPAPMVDGFPVISGDALEKARLARRDQPPDP